MPDTVPGTPEAKMEFKLNPLITFQESSKNIFS